jgi:hypothetical protein
MAVIARSAATKQTDEANFRVTLDCFATLAMTGKSIYLAPNTAVPTRTMVVPA